MLQKPSSDLISQIKNIKKLQSSDPFIKKIRDELEAKNSDRYVLRDDPLYKVGLDRNRIVMPGEMLREFIAEMHLIYGQIGGRKTYQIISEHFFAPQMRKLVNKILKTCDTCQKTKHLTRR